MKVTSLSKTRSRHHQHTSETLKGWLLFFVFVLITVYGFSQSAPRSCTFDAHNDLTVQLYSNSSNGVVHLQLPGSYSGKPVLMRLFDHRGQLVRQVDVLMDSTINISGYTPGVYYLQLFTDNEKFLQQIVKR